MLSLPLPDVRFLGVNSWVELAECQAAGDVAARSVFFEPGQVMILDLMFDEIGTDIKLARELLHFVGGYDVAHLERESPQPEQAIRPRTHAMHVDPKCKPALRVADTRPGQRPLESTATGPVGSVPPNVPTTDQLRADCCGGLSQPTR